MLYILWYAANEQYMQLVGAAAGGPAWLLFKLPIRRARRNPSSESAGAYNETWNAGAPDPPAPASLASSGRATRQLFEHPINKLTTLVLSIAILERLLTTTITIDCESWLGAATGVTKWCSCSVTVTPCADKTGGMVGIDLDDYRRHPALCLLQLDIEFFDIRNSFRAWPRTEALAEAVTTSSSSPMLPVTASSSGVRVRQRNCISSHNNRCLASVGHKQLPTCFY